jgi:hypothetical protein
MVGIGANRLEQNRFRKLPWVGSIFEKRGQVARAKTARFHDDSRAVSAPEFRWTSQGVASRVLRISKTYLLDGWLRGACINS